MVRENFFESKREGTSRKLTSGYIPRSETHNAGIDNKENDGTTLAKKNSKKNLMSFSIPKEVDNLTRNQLLALNFPSERYVADLIFAKEKNVKKNHADSFTSIISLGDCQAAKASLEDKSKGYDTVQADGRKYTIADIKNMITIHNLKSQKEQSINLSTWLDKPLLRPSPVCNSPEIRLIEEFKQWIFSKANCNIIIYPSTTTADLVTLCNDGWLELQTINAFVPIINASSQARKVFCLNSILAMNETDLERTIKDGLCDVEQLGFLLNVGKDRGRTFVSNVHVSGNHWTFLTIDICKGAFQYCDSLCWEVPQNLTIQIKRIITIINKILMKDITVPSMIPCAHKTQGRGGTHACKNDCSVNYPIQKCSYVCGIISIIMAAVFVNAPRYWKEVLSSNVSISSCWLKNPTQHSSYLRKVLISWLMKQCKDMSNLGIPVDKEPAMKTNPLVELTKERQEQEIQKCKQKSRDRRMIQCSSKETANKNVIHVQDSDENESSITSAAEASADDLLTVDSPLDQVDVNVGEPTLLNKADANRPKSPKAIDKPTNRNKGPVECSDCGAILSSKHCLYKHRLAKHPKSKPAATTSKLACKECDNERFNTMSELICHHRNKHGRNLNKLEKEFSSTEEFMIWKSEVEKKLLPGLSSFEEQNESRGDGKRAMKQQGTSKINGNCTAYIKALTSNTNGTVKIEFCLNHTGHEKELSHTRMPDALRKKIAGKLSKGVAIDHILDEIRNDTEEGISRAHLLDRKDIINVKHQFNVDLMEKDSSDTQSVHYWVNELRKGDYNPVLIYKPQGTDGYDLPKDDFLLGIQTQYQLEHLMKHGGKVICMDATHGTNQYDFLLISILVVDDYGEGLPPPNDSQPVMLGMVNERSVKSCLGKRRGAPGAQVHARTGPINTQVFMSDDCNNFYNSWISCFPKPAKKLLCAWHIDKNWRRGLREHIKTQDDIAEVYAALKTLQLEVNEATFRKLLQDFSSWCEESYPRFHAYFTEGYMKRPEQWATCFRAGTGINTNMYTEAFHNLLKGLYFQRKQNRRIDHLLCRLLKIARDKIFEGLIKAQKGKRTYRLKESEKRHKRGEAINEENIQQISPTSWYVLSQEDETISHKVSRLNEDCACKIKCSKCHVCHHMFNCECVDFNVRGIACKHIHAVQIQTMDSATNEYHEKNRQNDKEEDIEYFEGFLGADDNAGGKQRDLQQMKMMVMNKISSLTDIVQASISTIGLRTALAHVNSAITVAEGLNRLDYEHSYDIKPKHNYPPNKKFDLQQRFTSTKKKHVRPKKSLQQPTMKERRNVKAKLAEECPNVCAFCFKENDESNNEQNHWVECPQCGLWAHWTCDRNGTENTEDYMCSICLLA
eukprot:gene11705-12923_t